MSDDNFVWIMPAMLKNKFLSKKLNGIDELFIASQHKTIVPISSVLDVYDVLEFKKNI